MSLETLIGGLSRDEQIVAMELLWKRLTTEDPATAPPEWHRSVVAERDISDGCDFYGDIDPNLAMYFHDSISADIDSLLLYAGVHAKVDGLTSIDIQVPVIHLSSPVPLASDRPTIISQEFARSPSE